MSYQGNTDQYHQTFIEKLEVLYGRFDPDRNKFESTSNSRIARDLCYSDSQFSRLVNNTASEGEFKRAVRNVTRLLNENELQKKGKSSVPVRKNSKKWLFYLLGLIILLLSIFIIWQQTQENSMAKSAEKPSRFDMLQWSFENKYIKPYVKLKELPADCNFPCYKYQGKWRLKNEYRIPFFRERNGFHYVAKDATMYVRCMEESDKSGKVMEGYEYQKHEIWYDKREFPIDSFLQPKNPAKIREAYNNSDFSKDENFVKIAYVHTFFRNEFELDSNKVYRKGKAIGRDIEFLPEKELLKNLKDEKLVDELKNEINSIAKNRLEDFSKPINCEPSPVPKEDFNFVEEGDELTFRCQFTTGRFLVDYEKVFILEDQYINNYCR